jgi:3-hydroxyisobutyrate dehydrogenase-like beta-hydroxyacid dehydrogenase
LCSSLAEALDDAQLVVSAVTASSAQSVAKECGRFLRAGQWFLDINSISPHAKQENARMVEAGGARYVEAAVMAPVPPQRLKVPMLLGGKGARELSERLSAIGMNASVASEEIGVASAIKMCRSIMIKGMEALAVECLFAARRYGAEDAVLKSLHASFPSLGWNAEFPNYLVSRVAEHGRRRAAEMREVARTLNDVEVKPSMAEATAERQESLVDAMQAHGIDYDATKQFVWRELADQLQRPID